MKNCDLENEKVANTMPGDLWRLGEHRLLCGSATDASDVARLMDGRKADLLLTDPPYNIGYVGKTEDSLTIENDQMPEAQFVNFLTDAFRNAHSVLSPGASFYIWYGFTSELSFGFACKTAGLDVHAQLVWIKNRAVISRGDYNWRHEPCLFGWVPGARHRWRGGHKQSTVLFYDSPAASHDHPTMKPVPMFQQLIENSTKPGDLVLDLFCGSGTSIEAADRSKRVCYAMELDPHYCDVIVRRWEKMTGRKAERMRGEQDGRSTAADCFGEGEGREAPDAGGD